MNIDIWVAGFCVNNGKPTQQAACAVYMTYKDDQERSAERQLSFPLGNSTKNQADLQAAILGLLSVRKSFARNTPTKLYINNPYVFKAVDKADGAYTFDPKSNVELIENLRHNIAYFSSVEFVRAHADDFPFLKEAVTLAQSTTKTQKGTDSGTIEAELPVKVEHG